MTRPNPPWAITPDWTLDASNDQLQDAYIRLSIAWGKTKRDDCAHAWMNCRPKFKEIGKARTLVIDELERRGIERPDVAEFDEGEAVM